MDEPKVLKYMDLYKENFILSGGCYWKTEKILEAVEKIHQCDCYEDDIWLCTFPKSGTVWARTVILSILHNGDVELLENTIQTKKFKVLEIYPTTILETILKLPSPRDMLTTHVPFVYLPLQALQKQSKIIYVIRNPKDVAVSYYHFHRMNKHLGLYKGTFSEFFQFFMKGETFLCSWFDHVLAWWQQRETYPNILFIKYEDMKKDLKSQIQKIAQYLGYTLDEDTISSIQEYCQFETMVNNETINQLLFKEGHLVKTISPFFRKGDVGDWKNYLSEEENKQFDELFKVKMKGSGLDIEFEI